MSLSFKYRQEIFDGKKAYFPKIPVILFNKGHKFPTTALLDSGATHIFVPREIAEAIELKLSNPDTAMCWTGKFKVWESKVGLIVGKGSQTFRQTLFCNVPNKQTDGEEVVLGRNFFRHYQITFDELNKATTLKKSSLKPVRHFK